MVSRLFSDLGVQLIGSRDLFLCLLDDRVRKSPACVTVNCFLCPCVPLS